MMSLFPQFVQVWWQQRNHREQIVLVLLIIVVIIAGLYQLMIKPVVRENWKAKDVYVAADKDYQWLKQQINTLNQLRKSSGGILPKSIPADQLQAEIKKDFTKLRILADIRLGKKAGIEIVEIHLKSVSGSHLMQWIDNFSSKGRRIQTMDIENKNGFLFGTILVESN